MDPILAGLLIYLVLMIVVGVAASRYMNTLDDWDPAWGGGGDHPRAVESLPLHGEKPRPALPQVFRPCRAGDVGTGPTVGLGRQSF